MPKDNPDNVPQQNGQEAGGKGVVWENRKVIREKKKKEKQKAKEEKARKKEASGDPASNGEKTGKKPFGKKKKIVLAVVLAVVVILLTAAGVFAYRVFNPAAAFNDTQQALATPEPEATREETQQTDEAEATPEPTQTVDPYAYLLSEADLEFMQNRVNILLLGIDESIERSHWQSFRTDTMILLTIDFDTGEADMISLPRDSYVWIYNKDYRAKINSAFSSGGGYDKKRV